MCQECDKRNHTNFYSQTQEQDAPEPENLEHEEPEVEGEELPQPTELESDRLEQMG